MGWSFQNDASKQTSNFQILHLFGCHSTFKSFSSLSKYSTFSDVYNGHNGSWLVKPFKLIQLKHFPSHSGIFTSLILAFHPLINAVLGHWKHLLKNSRQGEDRNTVHRKKRIIFYLHSVTSNVSIYVLFYKSYLLIHTFRLKLHMHLNEQM